MSSLRIRTFAKFLICILFGAVFSSVVAFAWTGPTQTAPNGNVAAPVNVGTTDQIKTGKFGIKSISALVFDFEVNGSALVNSLAVFGNTILSGTSRYLNFGTIAEGQPPSSGYGIRDNAGTMEFKSSGGSWGSLTSLVSSAIQNFFASGSSGTVSQIKFSDGTTQTTAPVAGGGITTVTTASCLASCGNIGCTGSCVATCPATYFRTGCSSTRSGASPSGSAGCTCSSGYGSGNNNTCYAFCAK